MKKALTILTLILFVFVGYTFFSTGFFREINISSPNKIIARIALKGAEDIVVDQEGGFAIISATNRLVYPSIKPESGNLYFIDLTDEKFQPVNLTSKLELTFAPHGIDMMKISDTTYQILAINHINKQHSIEKFLLNGQELVHLKTLKNESMIQPNDLEIISQDEFYFTNDHAFTEGLGKIIEEYGGLSFSNVIRFNSDNYTEVATDIAYANGIVYDQKRKLLYVASPRYFKVKVFYRKSNGMLDFIEDIPAKTGVDNLTLDDFGNIWIGAHPNLLRFAAYAKGDYEISPSEIIKIKYESKNQFMVESLWVDNGEKMSGSTVAVPYNNWLLVGNVMDDYFLIIENDDL